MRRPSAPRPGLVLGALLCLIAVAACTDGGNEAPRQPDPGDAARAFVAAWNDGDALEMVKRLGDATLTSRELVSIVNRATLRAEAEFEVTISEDIDSGPAGDGDVLVAEVPYEIAYDVEDFDRPVLDGTFEMSLEDDEEWTVSIGRGLMFPGLPGAVRLEVGADWPKRGRILDRNKRVLARGHGRKRTYPFGALAGSTIGHVEPVTKRALADAAPHREIGDLVGASGLEEAYEERLAGEPDLTLRVVDRDGRSLEVLDEQAGSAGKDVRSTLDIRVQRAAAAAFGGTVGGAVVLDPASGDLLAAVTSYEIDPNGYVAASGVEPFNRALAGLYPPGSSMKVVTAGAALDSGVVGPSTQLTGPPEYQGVRNFESGAYPSLDFGAAVRFSVNTAFAQVALDLGARRITRYAEEFGFNDKPEMPLEAAESSFPFPEDPGDLMWGSIGQAQVLATPLQMASVGATVANRGVRMEPRSSRHDPKMRERVLSRRAANQLARLMEDVVNGGTGTSARIGGVRVAGKTGTAEVDVGGERRNHAWFVTFAPVDAPKVAIGVVSEYGGVGGQVAAPIARDIYAGVLPIVQ